MIQQPVRHGRGAALAKVLRTPEVVKAFLEPPASCKGNPLGKCPIGGKNQHRNQCQGVRGKSEWCNDLKDAILSTPIENPSFGANLAMCQKT